MVTPDTGVLSTPKWREITNVDILVKKIFYKVTQEKFTLYSLGTATLEAVSVSTFPGGEAMKRESHQTCMLRTGKKRGLEGTQWRQLTAITVCGLHHRAAVEAEMLT